MKKKIKLSVLMLALSISASYAQTNFSGSWAINKDKTDFGQAPQTVLPTGLQVTQNKQSVTIITNNLKSDGTFYIDTAKLVAGDTTVVQLAAIDRVRKYTIQWNAAKDSLTVTSLSQHLDGSTVGIFTDQWALSGNELAIHRKVKLAGGLGYEIVGHYNKQQ